MHLHRLHRSGSAPELGGGGGTTLKGHFFLKKKGAFSQNRKGTSLFIAKSGGMCPQCPSVPTAIMICGVSTSKPKGHTIQHKLHIFQGIC